MLQFTNLFKISHLKNEKNLMMNIFKKKLTFKGFTYMLPGLR